MRSLRVRMGLTQNQLARRAGVDPAYVNRLERASATSTSLPSRKVVLALRSRQYSEQDAGQDLRKVAAYIRSETGLPEG